MTDDATLVRNAVANAGRTAHERKPRWAHVTDVLATGSTSAAELCRRFGFDPDEQVGTTYATACDECGQATPIDQLQEHQGKQYGPCCWDERLRCTQ